jgi:hypothetical protein
VKWFSPARPSVCGYTFGPHHYRKDGHWYLGASPQRRPIQCTVRFPATQDHKIVGIGHDMSFSIAVFWRGVLTVRVAASYPVTRIVRGRSMRQRRPAACAQTGCFAGVPREWWVAVRGDRSFFRAARKGCGISGRDESCGWNRVAMKKR